MRHRTLPLLLLLSALTFVPGCEDGVQAPPLEGNPSTQGNFFPLSPDARWEYDVLQQSGNDWVVVNTTLRLVLNTVAHEGETGYLCVDSVRVNGQAQSQRYTLRRNEPNSHHVTDSRTSIPTDGSYGSWRELFRFGAVEVGETWGETNDQDGHSYWEMESTAESVTVTAGAFNNCRVNTRRSFGGNVETAERHVFASGVGEVLYQTMIWENGVMLWNSRRELTSYHLP